jgi:hypothetical protein
MYSVDPTAPSVRIQIEPLGCVPEAAPVPLRIVAVPIVACGIVAPFASIVTTEALLTPS